MADNGCVGDEELMVNPVSGGAGRPGLNGLGLSIWCMVAAFGAYFCMYAFRKPFTAGTYADLTFLGLGFKTLLVITQVMGYTVSKFVGIKVIAELEPRRRVVMFLALIGLAELALVMFGLTPAPWNFLWLFFNGLPLGMVFGLVLGFLEGRRHTEALTAGLCTSFIVADGAAKSVGVALLAAGVPPFWMPAVAGGLFIPPLLLFAWMLARIPAPDPRDVEARSERLPMSAADRAAFFRRYGRGLCLVGAAYLLVTVLRSLRADFTPELWTGLGLEAQPDVFISSEMLVAAGVLVLVGSTVLIRGNRAAFFTGLRITLAGAVLLVLTLAGHALGRVSPFAFMVAVGLGLYLPYITVHTTLFERLIAMTRDRGNIGYLMYLVDAFGYLGYVAVLLSKDMLSSRGDFLSFFLAAGWIIGVSCVLCIVPCWRYFSAHPAAQEKARWPALNQPVLEDQPR